MSTSGWKGTDWKVRYAQMYSRKSEALSNRAQRNCRIVDNWYNSRNNEFHSSQTQRTEVDNNLWFLREVSSEAVNKVEHSAAEAQIRHSLIANECGSARVRNAGEK